MMIVDTGSVGLILADKGNNRIGMYEVAQAHIRFPSSLMRLIWILLDLLNNTMSVLL